MADLTVEFLGLTFKNPIWSASGCFGYGTELADFFSPDALGAIVTKGISLKPMQGNEPPRIAETPCGMLNSIGLENVGVELFLSDKLPALSEIDSNIVVNFLGHSLDEYVQIATILSEQEQIDALEMNLSCPNVEKGGMAFGTNASEAASVVSAVRKVCTKPLIVKLSPNVTDIAEIARAVVAEGADALSLINTLLGMAIDVRARKPVLGRGVGGLSGPAIRPVALRMVFEVSKAVDVPIIGIGGIESGEDVAAFMLAGASAVQVGSAGLRDPLAHVRIISEFEAFCTEEGIESASSLIGALETE